jgi:hypothetical protein
LGTCEIVIISLNITNLERLGQESGRGTRACLCVCMPEAEASTNSQAAHCKRSAAGKADIALQPRMEPACSNADTACLFQVLGRVHNCTPFSRKRQRNGIHCRGSAWLKALFCLGQTFQVAECDKRPSRHVTSGSSAIRN